MVGTKIDDTLSTHCLLKNVGITLTELFSDLHQSRGRAKEWAELDRDERSAYRLMIFSTWINASNLKCDMLLSKRNVFIFCWISCHTRVDPLSSFWRRNSWLGSSVSPLFSGISESNRSQQLRTHQRMTSDSSRAKARLVCTTWWFAKSKRSIHANNWRRNLLEWSKMHWSTIETRRRWSTSTCYFA